MVGVIAKRRETDTDARDEIGRQRQSVVGGRWCRHGVWTRKSWLSFIGFTKKSCILLDSQKNLAFYWLLLVFTQKSWARPISEFREFPKIKNRAPFFTLLQAANTTRPPAHEAKLLGAHFFGLLRGKKGAPRVCSSIQMT